MADDVIVADGAVGGAALIRAMVRARQAAGLSQTEIGRRMGISQPAVSELEQSSDPRLSTLQRYARAIGGRLTVDVLKEDDE